MYVLMRDDEIYQDEFLILEFELQDLSDQRLIDMLSAYFECAECASLSSCILMDESVRGGHRAQ
jgi:hypothetical protein